MILPILALAVVSVTSQPAPEGGVVVSYRVTNDGSAPITTLDIGRRDGEPQLRELPAGFPESTAIGSPAGWTGMVITVEENELHFLSWENPTGLAPGATLEGFTVRLPAADPTYLEKTGFHLIHANSSEGTGEVTLGTPTPAPTGPGISRSMLALIGAVIAIALVAYVLLPRRKKS